MSEVFEGYERQYCEASASLTRKCTAAAALQGGNPPPLPNPARLLYPGSNLGSLSLRIVYSLDFWARREVEAEGGGDPIRHRWR